MLLISTCKNPQRTALTPIRCPHCRRGRICDTSTAPNKPKKQGPEDCDIIHIVLKCPSCGAPVSLTIE